MKPLIKSILIVLFFTACGENKSEIEIPPFEYQDISITKKMKLDGAKKKIAEKILKDFGIETEEFKEQELLDFNLVYHYIKHYIKYGIFSKNITIIPYGYLNFEKNYEKFKDICTHYNVPIYPIENFPYDFMTAHNKFSEWQKIDGIKCLFFCKWHNYF